MNNVNKAFYLKFSENYFNKNDILISENNTKLKVLETPHKKWYKQFLQWISLGWYKAPTMYKVKIIE